MAMGPVPHPQGATGARSVPAGGVIVMQNTNVRYGGGFPGGDCAGGMLCNTGGTFSFLDSVISMCTGGYAIFHPLASSGTTTISGSTAAASQINGNFYGIVLFGGTTTVATSTLGSNTHNSIYLATNGYLDVHGNLFSVNTEGAIWVYGDVSLVHSGNSTQGTGLGGIVVAGLGTKSQVWQAESSFPYIVSGLITVPSGKSLTVNPGTVVKFIVGAALEVNGTLVADSAASASKIYFTSIKDDAVGGDTNGDSSATSPAAGDWGEVKVNSGGSTTLNYAVARYGGGSADGAILYNNGGTLTAYNTEIATGTTYGVYNGAGTTSMMAMNVHNNSYGIYLGTGTTTIGSAPQP